MRMSQYTQCGCGETYSNTPRYNAETHDTERYPDVENGLQLEGYFFFLDMSEYE